MVTGEVVLGLPAVRWTERSLFIIESPQTSVVIASANQRSRGGRISVVVRRRRGDGEVRRSVNVNVDSEMACAMVEPMDVLSVIHPTS